MLDFVSNFNYRELELEYLLRDNFFIKEDLFRDDGIYFLDLGDNTTVKVGSTKNDVIEFLKMMLE